MEIMDSGAQVDFCWRLVKATQEGKVQWYPGEDPLTPETTIFGAKIGRFAYVLRTRDNDDFSPFIFSIYRTAPAEASAAEVETWKTENRQILDDPLNVLYTEVKRSLLKIDTTVADMFEDLAELEGSTAKDEDEGF